MDRSWKYTLNRDTGKITEGIKQIDLIDIYRIFHPKTKDYTFFSILVPSPKLTIINQNKPQKIQEI
jgi:exonuclease III